MNDPLMRIIRNFHTRETVFADFARWMPADAGSIREVRKGMFMDYYVDASAEGNRGDGTRECPFAKIQQAADVAGAGDTVHVLPGVYHENVNPKHAGTEDARITYVSETPYAAVITGAERITGWEHMEGTEGVYRTEVPNSLFHGNNPYTKMVRGDWFNAYHRAHLGEVYLNDKALYEVESLEGVLHPAVNPASWDPDFTVWTWYTEQDAEKDATVLYANFHDSDPNREQVEINVRENCFYPQEEGIGFITLRGFTITKAATQWAPPTAYQEGMVGPHWSRGWIIEDCDLSHSKCSGISLGKYRQKGNDNKWLETKFKDGTQTQRDCVMQAVNEGWTKENVGHHIIRRCRIHDCGQTGIVGHLGGAFSLIEDNHIYRINNRQNLAGAEIGGIKMHAAIDVIFRRNHIHHCTRGIWLDWEAQGTRVTQNLFHDNTLAARGELCEQQLEGLGEDLFIEVSHGPTLVDHNLFLSERALKIPAQGMAFVHNLICGSLVSVSTGTDNGAPNLPSPRYTPYHLPHDTKVAGFMTILHGDDRFINNIFVQQKVRPFLQELYRQKLKAPARDMWDDNNIIAGTCAFDVDPYETQEEWEKHFDGYCGMGSVKSDRYYLHLPLWMEGNYYFNGAKPWSKEKAAEFNEQDLVTIRLVHLDGEWILNTNLYDLIPLHSGRKIGTKDLGTAFEPEEPFESPDGSPIVLDTDYLGNQAGDAVTAGPFENAPDPERPVARDL